MVPPEGIFSVEPEVRQALSIAVCDTKTKTTCNSEDSLTVAEQPVGAKGLVGVTMVDRVLVVLIVGAGDCNSWVLMVKIIGAVGYDGWWL